MKHNILTQEIVQRIKSVISEREFTGLHEPYFGGNEWDYTKQCLDTGWVSSVGKFVTLFEDKLKEYTGIKYAVATVNGTAALHICLKLCRIEAGDEVLMPALTFVATANAISYCGAVPHFVESEEKTLGLDPRKLESYLCEIAEVTPEGCFNKQTGRRIKAVLPMHTFGHPVDMDLLIEVSERFRLEIIEDCAESLGSFYKGKHTGQFGKVAALSFNGNKIITTGGGGAILTNDAQLAELARHVTTTAKVPHRWEFFHDMTAYNYRLPNINSALGCAQLEQLENFLLKKRALTLKYKEAFAGLSGVKFVTEPDFAQSNYWLNAVLLAKEFVGLRDSLLETTNASGIMTRPVWILMNKLPMYKDCPKMELLVAESIESRLINIPSSVFLGEKYV